MSAGHSSLLHYLEYNDKVTECVNAAFFEWDGLILPGGPRFLQNFLMAFERYANLKSIPIKRIRYARYVQELLNGVCMELSIIFEDNTTDVR